MVSVQKGINGGVCGGAGGAGKDIYCSLFPRLLVSLASVAMTCPL